MKQSKTPKTCCLRGLLGNLLHMDVLARLHVNRLILGAEAADPQVVGQHGMGYMIQLDPPLARI